MLILNEDLQPGPEAQDQQVAGGAAMGSQAESQRQPELQNNPGPSHSREPTDQFHENADNTHLGMENINSRNTVGGGEREADKVPDQVVREKIASLITHIKQACDSLSIQVPAQPPSEKLELWMESAFGKSLSTAWEIGQAYPEEYLRALITAHIFHDVLATSFPERQLGLDAPFLWLYFDFHKAECLLITASREKWNTVC
ncbi:hypothetical protein PG993_002568 [Apiospora rasikravindrae]|uniref:Uncharacterized protein n=1 Tax=Apiospora rasikravindrae TaxID=990691 RepID=A0ABR1TZM4_9PEZI